MKDAAGAERPSRGHELLLVQLVFVSFAGAATLVRAYVKVFLVGRVTSDDYLIFAAMVRPIHLFSDMRRSMRLMFKDRGPMQPMLQLP